MPELLLDTLEQMSLERTARAKRYERSGWILDIATGDDIRLMFDAAAIAGMPALGDPLDPDDAELSPYILRRQVFRPQSGNAVSFVLSYEINTDTGGGGSSLVIRDAATERTIRSGKIPGINQSISVAFDGIPDAGGMAGFVLPQNVDDEFDIPMRELQFTAQVVGAPPANPREYVGYVNSTTYYDLPTAYWKLCDGGLDRNIYEGTSVVYATFRSKALEDWSKWQFCRHPVTGARAYRESAIPAIANLTYRHGVINAVGLIGASFTNTASGIIRYGANPTVNFNAVLPYFQEI